MAVQNIRYNNYSLQDTSAAASKRLTTNILYNQLPDKVIDIKQDTTRDGFDIIASHYSQKVITANGWLISDTGANLKTLIDTFKNSLRPNEKSLDIETYGGSGVYTRWVATTRSITVNEEHWQITQKPWTCEWLCQPFGKATSTTTVDLNSGNNITSTPYNESPSITGTYKCKPTITITVVSETDLTAIKFENTSNLDWIQVARSFSAAEVLTINCENETIQVDGSNVDFTGVFPRLSPGTNVLSITSTDSGAFAISVSFTYYPTYL